MKIRSSEHRGAIERVANRIRMRNAAVSSFTSLLPFTELAFLYCRQFFRFVESAVGGPHCNNDWHCGQLGFVALVVNK